jgi:lysophospholipase L1-like esterase
VKLELNDAGGKMKDLKYCRSAIFMLLVPVMIMAGDQGLTIVAFGDSTTAYRHNVEQAYTDRLPPLLAARGVQATVINSGVGGNQTGRMFDNLRHLDFHARDRLWWPVRRHRPDIAVIQFGWNDSYVDSGQEDGTPRLLIADYEKNLRYIVGKLTRDGARVILMTPNRPRSDFEPWRFERTETYVEVVRKIARDTGVELAEIWRAYADYNAAPNQNSDGLLLDLIHPNDLGHDLVARMLAEIISRTQRPQLGGATLEP